jgi:hypothetical protein
LDTLSPEFFGTLAAVLPAVSYSFMHCGPEYSCERIYQLCTGVVSLFETEPIVSLHHGICALVLVVGTPAQSWVIYDYFIKSAATTYFRLATRRVPGWVWIHASELRNKFEPV